MYQMKAHIMENDVIFKIFRKSQYLGCPLKKWVLHIFCNTENTYILISLKLNYSDVHE